MTRLFFLHIPRCAGTTLHSIIEKQYAPEESFLIPSVAWNDQNFRAIREEWTQEQRDRIRVVRGHMIFGWHEAWGKDDFTYITVLRYPVSWALSMYRYTIQGGNPDDFDLAKDDPRAFFEKIGNYQTQAVSGMLGCQQQYALEMAKARLLNHFSVVGLVERLPESIRQMEGQFGWHMDDLPHLNASRQTGLPFSVEVIDAIYECNWMDLALYDWASKEFWS